MVLVKKGLVACKNIDLESIVLGHQSMVVCTNIFEWIESRKIPEYLKRICVFGTIVCGNISSESFPIVTVVCSVFSTCIVGSIVDTKLLCHGDKLVWGKSLLYFFSGIFVSLQQYGI